MTDYRNPPGYIPLTSHHMTNSQSNKSESRSRANGNGYRSERRYYDDDEMRSSKSSRNPRPRTRSYRGSSGRDYSSKKRSGGFTHDE